MIETRALERASADLSALERRVESFQTSSVNALEQAFKAYSRMVKSSVLPCELVQLLKALKNRTALLKEKISGIGRTASAIEARLRELIASITKQSHPELDYLLDRIAVIKSTQNAVDHLLETLETIF